MMFRYSLNLPDDAAAIEEAVRRTLDRGVATRDLGGSETTTQMGDAILQDLDAVLGKSE